MKIKEDVTNVMEFLLHTAATGSYKSYSDSNQTLIIWI